MGGDGGDGGNDVIYGGDGNDTIEGWAGDDSLYGDAGNDWISGGNNDDAIAGNDGMDQLWGDNAGHLYPNSPFAAGTDDICDGGSPTSMVDPGDLADDDCETKLDIEPFF